MKKQFYAALVTAAYALAMMGCGGGGGGSSAAGAGSGGIGENTGQAPTASQVPATAQYDVVISGTTYSGNTSFPAAQTIYSPTENFTLNGALIVEPTRDRNGANFDNGINPRDIGLFVGNPPANPLAGSVWFVTNSQVSQDVGIGNIAQGLAQIDVAFVALDEQTGSLSIVADDRFVGTPITRSSQLNVFNRLSGPLAFVFQIVAGNMQLQFTNNGATVGGSFDFIGNGFIEPGTSRVRATISGTRRQ